MQSSIRIKNLIKGIVVVIYTFLNLKIILSIWNEPLDIWRAVLLRDFNNNNGGFVFFSIIIGFFLNVIVILYFLRERHF